MLSSTAAARNEVRYDSLGRIVQRASPCTWTSLTTTCSYWATANFDALNRLTPGAAAHQLHQQHLADDDISVRGSNEDCHRSSIECGDNDQRREWVAAATKDAVGYVVTLGYDAAGSETSVTDSLSNGLWSGTYGYGTGAFLTSATDMDLGAWTYGVDALGERTSWHDAKGQSL